MGRSGCVSRGSSMREYRIYTIGSDGRAWSAEDIEYRDDQEAIQKARWIVHGRDVELWKRGRFIARLPGMPGAVPHPIIYLMSAIRALRGRTAHWNARKT